jgi:hypothetical protein
MTHPLAFTAPQPFWRPGSADSRTAISQPQILRFANDEFIEELLATLERDPGALPAYAAQPETWRGPMLAPAPRPDFWTDRKPSRLLPIIREASAKATPHAVVKPVPLKLYQPAHQRHYLVAGSLVCRTPGLPDRAIDTARQKVSFVIRRLFPTTPVPAGQPLPVPDDLSGWHEYAWVLAGKSGEWRKVGTAASEAASARMLEGEERLAMFPARYAQADGQPRRLYIGSVPVGRRESYQGGQASPEETGNEITLREPRIVQLHTDVLAPWKSLVNRGRDLDGNPPPVIFAPTGDSDFNETVPRDEAHLDFVQLYKLRSDLQIASWYVLLDLRRYLEAHVPDYTGWLDANASGAPPAGTPMRALHDALARVATPAVMRAEGNNKLSLAHTATGFGSDDVAPDLPDALRRITNAGTMLEAALTGAPGSAAKPFAIPISGVTGYTTGWPGFLFLFVDPWFDVPTPVPGAQPPGADDFGAEALQAQIDGLEALVQAIAPNPAAKLPEPTLASLQPTDMREAWYVMRLVHERPDCEPFEGPVVSRATVPFQMAGFFDPDAPARPIRIGLPLDISPAGLRKFDKNAVFVMSDMLCGHIDRFKGMTFGDLVLSVLPWPFHKDLSVPDKGPCRQGGLELGVMCSLSIPIITICALILLMIIVSLLDLIFRWLPFFVVCFPLPGFKGRKDGS